MSEQNKSHEVKEFTPAEMVEKALDALKASFEAHGDEVELLAGDLRDEKHPPANDNVVAGVDGAQGAKDAE